MPEFYHNLITEKSFKILQDLRKKFEFILIGGWAVFLYSGALKSKDIDIIIDYDELQKLKNDYDVFKNDRFKKYEIKIEEIDIDIYLPYFSKLGLKAEEIQEHRQNLEGFSVPIPEVLLILKINAYRERKGSNKGEKDLIDIFSLLKNSATNWAKYKELIRKYNIEDLNEEFKNLISSQKRVPELDLSDHRIAKLKKDILAQISDI